MFETLPLSSSSQINELSLKFKPLHVFLVNSEESNLYLLCHQIRSVVAFLFIFQIPSAFSIYHQIYLIKVCKQLEENADELSQNLHFSIKHILGITVFF